MDPGIPSGPCVLELDLGRGQGWLRHRLRNTPGSASAVDGVCHHLSHHLSHLCGVRSSRLHPVILEGAIRMRLPREETHCDVFEVLLRGLEVVQQHGLIMLIVLSHGSLRGPLTAS